jgi:hypothetical protein
MILKKSFAYFLSAVLTFVPSLAFAQAALVPNAQQTFVGANGVPLAGGSVSMYVPNTTTPKSTWQDSGQTILNTSPITLDSAGRAIINGQGSYRQIVKDSLNNLQWDGLTSSINASPVTGSNPTDTAPVGTIMPWAGTWTNVPANWLPADGRAISRSTYSALFATSTIANPSTGCTINSNVITGLVDTTQLSGQANDNDIEASCLPSGTVITDIISANSVHVSNNAVATTTVSSTIFIWGNGDGTTTFNVPDLRGYVMAASDGLGGTHANRLFFGSLGNVYASGPGHTGGHSTQSYTIAQANLPSYNLSASIPVTGNTGSMALNGSITGTTSSAVTSVSTGTGTFANGGNSAVNSVTAPTNTLSVSGTFSGTGSTTISGTAAGNVPSGGGGTGLLTTLVQPTVTINYIIKVLPTSTGAGGVVSMQGLFGDVTLDQAFTALGAQTVSGLPTCNGGAQGIRRFVTDANSTTFHATAVGGGANKMSVVCDGTVWYID